MPTCQGKSTIESPLFFGVELGLSVVAEEADGKRAYEAYLKHHPDIVVVDIKTRNG